MSTIKMDRAERLIGYTFTQRDLLWEALQVAGSGQARIGGRDTSKGNERLAIVGDSILSYVLSKEWYATGENKGEAPPLDRSSKLTLDSPGSWTNHRTSVLSNDNLGRIAKSTGLVDCLNMNPMNRIRNISDKLAATLVEAICGAAAEDGTLDDVVDVMRSLDITLLVMCHPHSKTSSDIMP
jgi:dsRNA-specific ribonuclease